MEKTHSLGNDALLTVELLVIVFVLIVHFFHYFFCDDSSFHDCFYASGQVQILLCPALTLSSADHIENFENFQIIDGWDLKVVGIRCFLNLQALICSKIYSFL